ncbi:MAG: DUF4112 domain-containing protein [Pseudomonadota bacterium]
MTTDVSAIVVEPRLPPDVEALKTRLVETQKDVGDFKRNADGMLFGLVGLDAFLTLIPAVGGAYSTFGGFYLLQQAIKAKCSFGTITMGVAMVIADVIVGIFVGIGDIIDVLFRSHAWFAGMILNEVELKLAHIEETKTASSLGALSADGSEMTALRDQLFRGGKSETGLYVRLGIVALVCGFVLYECRRAEDVRQANIRACEERGGWFCSFR